MESDIQSKVRRDFRVDEFPAAIEAIHKWDADRKGLLEDRVVRCAVYLARGNLDRLREMISIGMRDDRELIAAAEYEGTRRVRDFHTHFKRAADNT